MGLRRVPVTSPEGFERLMAKGHKERSTGVTSANAHSSRSHAVIRIDVVVKGKQSKPGWHVLMRYVLWDHKQMCLYEAARALEKES